MGIQGSWTKSVIENFCPMELSFDSYEPITIIFLRNGEILMFNDDDPRVVVYYNQESKSFRETRITLTTSPLIGSTFLVSILCFTLCLYDVSNGEEVKRY